MAGRNPAINHRKLIKGHCLLEKFGATALTFAVGAFFIGPMLGRLSDLATIVALASLIAGILAFLISAMRRPRQLIRGFDWKSRDTYGGIFLFAGCVLFFGNLVGSSLGVFPEKLGAPAGIGLSMAILGMALSK